MDTNAKEEAETALTLQMPASGLNPTQGPTTGTHSDKNTTILVSDHMVATKTTNKLDIEAIKIEAETKVPRHMISPLGHPTNATTLLLPTKVALKTLTNHKTEAEIVFSALHTAGTLSLMVAIRTLMKALIAHKVAMARANDKSTPHALKVKLLRTIAGNVTNRTINEAIAANPLKKLSM